jgi:hypothetical protein
VSTPDAPPALRVVRGDPTVEEVAALLAVVIGRSAGSRRPQPASAGTSTWTDRASLVAPAAWPRPGGWVGSGRAR